MRTIETKTARTKLPVAKDPVFVRLGQGVSIGYRRNAGGAGVWIVRIANGKRGRTEKRIALADDLSPADGRGVMDFAQAVEAARRLGRGESDAPDAASVVTLGDAIDAYQADLDARGAGGDNVTRLRGHISPTMAQRPVKLLDVSELRRWRDALAKKLAPASVNRTITILKATLNLAAQKDQTLNARSWQIGLGAIPEATVARNVVLPEAKIRRLVDAARDHSPEFGLLIEALASTGARISQLARCTGADLADDRILIPSSAKGRKKRATRVPVPIPASLAERLRAAAAGRPITHPLFVKPCGAPWGKSDHTRPVARAVAAIGEDPATITVYALRHSHITAQLLASLPVQLVARLHDTSASQIERHYAATIASHADELVRGAMADFDRRPRGDVVVPLRR